MYRPHLEGKKGRNLSVHSDNLQYVLGKKDILAVHKKLDSITDANEASEVSRLILE